MLSQGRGKRCSRFHVSLNLPKHFLEPHVGNLLSDTLDRVAYANARPDHHAELFREKQYVLQARLGLDANVPQAGYNAAHVGRLLDIQQMPILLPRPARSLHKRLSLYDAGVYIASGTLNFVLILGHDLSTKLTQQGCRVGSPANAIVPVNHSVDNQTANGIVQATHTLCPVGLDDVGDFVKPVFTDAVSNRGIADHHLAGRSHAGDVDPAEQSLRNDGLERVGQHAANHNVRVLSQRVLQAAGECRYVRADLALLDET